MNWLEQYKSKVVSLENAVSSKYGTIAFVKAAVAVRPTEAVMFGTQ